MTKAKAVLETPTMKRLVIALDVEEKATIGYARDEEGVVGETPDYDLGQILPSETLAGVAGRHAVMTYREGDFWLKSLEESATQIGKYELNLDQYFRLVDRDTVSFGDAQLVFRILEEAQEAKSDFDEARYR